MSLVAHYEVMLFMPKWYHVPLIVLLSPLSLLYGLAMWLRRVLSVKKDFGIPIVSIGNLMVGGSGKTPFTIALAENREGVYIISRGYGRQSKGMIVVSDKGRILTDVYHGGDEAMLMAKSLPLASVIVSEDRPKAIEYAKAQGAKIIFLDDGFNQVKIKKLEILLEPQKIHNYFPFPSGGFREFFFAKRYADIIVKEEKDFFREVSIDTISTRMLLVTAISNPNRLDKYLPEGIIERLYFPDHAYFDEAHIIDRFKHCGAQRILCTSKDKVKLEKCQLPLSEMKLKLRIDNAIMQKIENHIGSPK